jgi:hypothetical protein
MTTTIKLKNSVTTTNAPTSLVQGEVAINITDKKVWVGNAATTPVQLLGDGGSVNFTTVDTTNLQVTNIKAKDGTASASIANSTGIFTHATATVFTAGTVSAPSITTTGDTNTGIYFPAADTIAFTEGGVESMRIDASGNVGIGATSASKLTVNGNIQLGSAANTVFTNNITTYDNSTISLNASTSLLLNTAGTERIRVTNTGDVGIGTNSPSYKLQVANATAIDTEVAVTNSAGIARYGIRGSGNAFAGAFSSGKSFEFWASGSQFATLSNTGNFGIGTNNPAVKLQINSATFAPNANLTNNLLQIKSTGGFAYLTIGNGDSANSTSYIGGASGLTTFGLVSDAGSTSEFMRITNGGFVGIGVSSPSNQLEVAGAARVTGSTLAGGNFYFNNTSGTSFKSAITWLASGSAKFSVGVDAASTGNNNFFIYDDVAGTTRMSIDSSGNLLFNSGYGSSAIAYGCRAWVNFDGTGTVAIRGSANVSSITDNGVGDYTVNFTNAMPNANYSAVSSCGNDGINFGTAISVRNFATTSVRINTGYINTGGASVTEDKPNVTVAIFR